MSYTTSIKNEIAFLEKFKSETIAELSGFIRNNGYIGIIANIIVIALGIAIIKVKNIPYKNVLIVFFVLIFHLLTFCFKLNYIIKFILCIFISNT